MTVETQITFRGITPFDQARDIVRTRLARIDRRLPRGTRCVVLIERIADAQRIGSRRIHARVQLLGTGIQVSTLVREDDGTDALRMALARAEDRLVRQRGDGPARTRAPAALHAL